jgi:Flp pilus assembly pilin Flp
MADPGHRPSRRGLAEYLLLVGFLVVAAAGAIALFGDEIRGAFGVPPAAPARAAALHPPAG